MKFPRPRVLLQNDYPDLIESQPELVKSLIETVKPPENSPMDEYLKASIDFLKKQKGKQVSVS